MTRRFTRTRQQPAVIDFGKTPAPSPAKQKPFDISWFHRLIGKQKACKSGSFIVQVGTGKNADCAFCKRRVLPLISSRVTAGVRSCAQP